VSTTIVGGDRLAGELARLEPLAEAMFGGPRRSGWLARKLERECVDPRSSALLVRGRVEPDARVDVDRVVGYVLVGRPPSLCPVARGAGVGLHPSLRGQRLGTELVEAAVERSANAGASALEFLAEPARVDWYGRMGFAFVRTEWTLQSEATGEHDRFEWTLGPGPEREEVRVWSWILEAWQRTPAAERGWFGSSIATSRARAWATREGRAVLIHRFEFGEPGQVVEAARIVDALNEVRAGLPRGTPLLLYPIPARRSWPRALLDAGWTIAQQSSVVRRDLAR
jgi:GNAT superfamily N-acetyltransferase